MTDGEVSPIDRPEFRSWVRERVAVGRDRFTEGYQGQIHLYRGPGGPLVVKTVGGRAPLVWIRRAMLRRERRVYRALEGFEAAPHCHGIVDGRYLVLEFLDGLPYRHARIVDPEAFFEAFLARVRTMHERGVAHGDLQKKDNVVVIDDRPWFVDFGTAIVRRPGFRPLNRWLFGLLCQLDLNTWAKLKAGGRPKDLSEGDLRLYHRTLLERWAAALKGAYTALRWPGGRPPRRRRPPGSPPAG